jgi:hypothetical protein
MGRISYKKKAWMKNLRSVRTFPELVTENQSETSAVVSDQQAQIVEETSFQSVSLNLKDVEGNKKQAFSRGLEYSARYQRKLKQKNREMPKGSAKISSYFNVTNSESVAEDIQVESEADKLKIAYDSLTSKLAPVINSESAQQKAGTYERAKYQAVYKYLKYRIEGVKKIQASVLAAQEFWYDKATTYRSNVIRNYAEEYINSGEISKGFQGKHSKRFSVLDDNDIKRKIVEWFRTVPKFQRNIPDIQNQLRTVILPALIEGDSLQDEIDETGVIANQLSTECIRKKLIEWGFHFKRVGKLLR